MSFLKSVQKIPMSKVILWKRYILGTSKKIKNDSCFEGIGLFFAWHAAYSRRWEILWMFLLTNNSSLVQAPLTLVTVNKIFDPMMQNYLRWCGVCRLLASTVGNQNASYSTVSVQLHSLHLSFLLLTSSSSSSRLSPCAELCCDHMGRGMLDLGPGSWVTSPGHWRTLLISIQSNDQHQSQQPTPHTTYSLHESNPYLNIYIGTVYCL